MTNSIPKFHTGNLCKLLTNDYGYKSGTEVIIKAQSHHTGSWNYSLVVLEDGNHCSWTEEDELEFVDIGGEHLFEQAEENERKRVERNTDIKYIRDNLDHLNSESILYLFDLIGYKSLFLKTGEFGNLYMEWESLSSIFKVLKASKSLDDAIAIFKKYGIEDEDLGVFKLKEVWDAYHQE